MTYLLDTNAFSDLMREQPDIRAHVESLLPADRLVICTIVRGEIRYGVSRLPEGKKKQDLETKAEKLFAAITCEPVPFRLLEEVPELSCPAAAGDTENLHVPSTEGAGGSSFPSDFRFFAK
ncbi:MAG: PIN domain-containing protein [Verrucomicrobia bacterium]|nr:PIN domain-containing protein [Verrucomicrobiota bacterium]